MKIFPQLSFDPQKLLRNMGNREFAFFETSRVSETDHCSYCFSRPVARLRCRAADDPRKFLGRAQEQIKRGMWLAGWFAYEFGYLLEPVLADLINVPPASVVADLGVFTQAAVFDHQQGKALSGCWPPVRKADQPTANQGRVSNLRLNQQQDDYLSKIKRIKEYIRAGDTYQVNYTLKQFFDFNGSYLDLYQMLRRNQSVSYSACIQTEHQQIMSFSPELFFRRKDDCCMVRPMKGTTGRGRTLKEDQAAGERLRQDEKNRSENVMIVDLLRNDLGRVCRMGSVKTHSLFDIEPYETLQQMTSTISGQLEKNTSLVNLFAALFPCGSVTGAPKIRTMEIIRELELEPRGVYTGAIGFVSPTGDCCFNVPIRTVILKNGQGEMGIGSGIVADSAPEQEWRECLLKGNFLTRPQPEFQLIETLLWRPGSGFWLLDSHLKRIRRSALYFYFNFIKEQCLAALEKTASDFTGPQRVRLLLHKNGTMELSATPCDLPQNETFAAVKDQEPLPVCLADVKTDSCQVTLFHKTTLRKMYDKERSKAVEQGYFELFFTNERDEITEGAISNIFIKKNGVFYTPPVVCGLLAGVMRNRLLADGSGRVREKILSRTDLRRAEAVYMVNSVRGVVPVIFGPECE
jgi:para-aminobenzoate synthetase/4-amino-4-deoxychorismate lyase